MQLRGVYISGFIVLALSLFACKENGENGKGETFNRSLLLEQSAQNLLLPSFDSFAFASESFQQKLYAFTNNTQQSELIACQDEWLKVLRQFQFVRMYNFGPSEDPLLGDHNENLGTWPIDTALLESRIASADFTMKDFRRDTRGLGALEYLLFEPQALSRFQSNDAANRKSYLNSLTADLTAWSQKLKNDWLVYSASYKVDTGKSAGSATSELYNHWLQSYELLKNYKVALPAGLQVGQTGAAPHLVESPFAHASIRSIKWQVEALESIWYGKARNALSGIGFDDYLLTLTGGEALHAEIVAQWISIHNVLDAIADDTKLSELVLNDPQKAQALFTELQKMTRFIKGDMSSLLGIAITYSSGDGD